MTRAAGTRPRASATGTARPARSFAGTWQLARLALRRDRLVLPLWIVLLGIIPSSSVRAYETFYPTMADRRPLTASIGANPSVRLIYGQGFDLSTGGGYVAWKFGTFLATLVALACIFTITRHTRQEEDTGRQELLSSGVVGRYATLTAAVLVGAGASLCTGLIVAGGMKGAGTPSTGALLFGLSATLVGWVFVGVTAVAAQLAEYSRTVNGLSSAVLGLVFLLRAVGDSNNGIGWLSWISPIGWATQVRPYAGDRAWVLSLPLATSVALVGLAYALLLRRDTGMGFFPARLGPAEAAPGLRTSFALAWRLHRGVLLGWLAGFAVVGAVFGSLAAGIGDLVGNTESARQIFERMGGQSGLVDAYLSTISGIFGVIVSLYAVQAGLRMRAEETAFRVEPLLATRIGRLRWAAGHLAFALLGSAALLAAAGTTAGLMHGLHTGRPGHETVVMLGASVAQLPAVWVVAGLSTLLFGLLPKQNGLAWAVAALFVAIGMFGAAVNLPQTALDLSPFSHIPKFPGVAFTATPFAWLLAIAAVTLGAGLVSFRRRDIG